MQGFLRRLSGMEAVELMVMESAAVKADHSKISERWGCYAEADSQYAK